MEKEESKLFSKNTRKTDWEKVDEKEYDLIIIGGGITGAGIALDGASRGMSCVLFEMQDYGAGTSSRSTKLIHGGLRYLKNFEIGVVAEVGKERAIVYENAPHITTPLRMLLPVYKKYSPMPKFMIAIGLMVYDFLAGVKSSERKKMLSADGTLSRENLLSPKNLTGGGDYVEYRTDDARLTISVIKSANKKGAKTFNYTKVTNLIYDNSGKISGVEVTDKISGETKKVFAKIVINATGPWVDFVRDMDKSKFGKTLHWTKGVHFVVDQKKFPLKNSIYMDTPDGRMIFCIPRGDKTYVGTTDTDYKGNIEKIYMDKVDCEYLLKMLKPVFPNLNLTLSDIESSWAGVRPLIHEEGKSPSAISRKEEILFSKSG
ncbi:MAG: glycerol-3-phosphate dehydrogenase/oxidase, partial [Fusobacteriaceae bacterium]